MLSEQEKGIILREIVIEEAMSIIETDKVFERMAFGEVLVKTPNVKNIIRRHEEKIKEIIP